MSANQVNLANFNKGMSRQSNRSTASPGSKKQNENSKTQLVNAAKNTLASPHKETGPIQVVEGALNQRNDQTIAQDLSKTDAARRTKNYTAYDVDAVHDDVKQSYVANPNIPHDEEAEYYETVRRLDVCGHCWTDQRKYCTQAFKLREKGPGNTLYQKDFVKHPLNGKAPVVKNDFYSTFNIAEPMDLNTTHKKDYKPYEVEAPQRATMAAKNSASGIPFGGKSGYKVDYINWGNMPVNFEKAPHNITIVKDLPFMGKTAYMENFSQPNACEQAKPVDRDLWNTKKKSPLSTGIPFLGQTTTANTYKPYKVEGAPMFTLKEEYEPTESYPNQFKSTYDQDFVQHDGKLKCPAKVFMETHNHPRAKTMKH
jgi:hypothetical protein